MGKYKESKCWYLQKDKRTDKKMKIFGVIILIIALVVGGWFGYQYYQKWEERKFNEIEFLKRNQDMMVQKITDLSVTVTKVVNDTVKVQTVTKEDATYEEIKKKVIELQKDEKANKEEIKKLREDLSIQRKAFLASDYTILISGKNDETYLLYRDESGNLQPASDNIEKIIEHKDIKLIPLPIEEVKLDKANWNIKAGGYYSFDNSYGVIISKGIINIKDYSLNVSLLIQDFEDFRFVVGGDVGYMVRDNIELAFGYNTDKEFYGALRWSF